MAVENRQLTGRLAIPDRQLFFEAPVTAQDRDVKTVLGRVAPQLVERCNDVSMNADGQSLGVGGRAEVGGRLASEVSRLHSSHSVSPMTSNCPPRPPYKINCCTRAVEIAAQEHPIQAGLSRTAAAMKKLSCARSAVQIRATSVVVAMLLAAAPASGQEVPRDSSKSYLIPALEIIGFDALL